MPEEGDLTPCSMTPRVVPPIDIKGGGAQAPAKDPDAELTPEERAVKNKEQAAREFEIAFSAAEDKVTITVPAEEEGENDATLSLPIPSSYVYDQVVATIFPEGEMKATPEVERIARAVYILTKMASDDFDVMAIPRKEVLRIARNMKQIEAVGYTMLIVAGVMRYKAVLGNLERRVRAASTPMLEKMMTKETA